jgi:aspartyl-tRNA synthetase
MAVCYWVAKQRTVGNVIYDIREVASCFIQLVLQTQTAINVWRI